MKTILVTGATAGFGQAAAKRFASGGWRVIGTGRRGDRLRQLQDEIGDSFLPLEIDMRDLEALGGIAQLSPPWGEIAPMIVTDPRRPPRVVTCPARS